MGRGSTAPDKPGAIRFAGDLPAWFYHHQVQEPRPLFGFGAGAPGAENGSMFPQELCLNEEIAEDRMSQISPRSRTHHLSVTRQLDCEFGLCMIHKSVSTPIDVVFRRKY